MSAFLAYVPLKRFSCLHEDLSIPQIAGANGKNVQISRRESAFCKCPVLEFMRSVQTIALKLSLPFILESHSRIPYSSGSSTLANKNLRTIYTSATL